MARYPIGLQDFKEIIEGGYVYVDKTAFIQYLLEGSKYYFLGRPRRFGKSLFLSTLEYFFKGERHLFKGRDIEAYDWKWCQYPVIRIDLSPKNYSSKTALLERLDSILSRYEAQFEVSTCYDKSIEGRFETLIEHAAKIAGKQVVILVDEYEKPVVDLLGKEEEMENNREILRGFYSVLKSSDKYLKLVFLTGVTKFGQMSIFSGLNNINDISLDDEFGCICGITEKELKENFKDGLKEMATANVTEEGDILQLLKSNYDGYHFSRNCPDLYNPYSLILALSKKKISSYWAATGTPTVLAKMLVDKNYNLENTTDLGATENQLLGDNNRFEDPVALMYQTGYLTIKSYDAGLEEYRLGFPNYEVAQAFRGYILPYYTKISRSETDSTISNFKRAINRGEPEKAMQELEAFSASISYDLIPSAQTERHFQMLLDMIVKLIVSSTVKVTPEFKTSDGRIDLLIETPEYVYIIEIKKDKNAEVAMMQIENKKYWLPFANNLRTVFLIGINFSTKKRRIDGYCIKTLN